MQPSELAKWAQLDNQQKEDVSIAYEMAAKEGKDGIKAAAEYMKKGAENKEYMDKQREASVEINENT